METIATVHAADDTYWRESRESAAELLGRPDPVIAGAKGFAAATAQLGLLTYSLDPPFEAGPSAAVVLVLGSAVAVVLTLPLLWPTRMAARLWSRCQTGRAVGVLAAGVSLGAVIPVAAWSVHSWSIHSGDPRLAIGIWGATVISCVLPVTVMARTSGMHS